MVILVIMVIIIDVMVGVIILVMVIFVVLMVIMVDIKVRMILVIMTMILVTMVMIIVVIIVMIVIIFFLGDDQGDSHIKKSTIAIMIKCKYVLCTYQVFLLTVFLTIQRSKVNSTSANNNHNPPPLEVSHGME